MIAKKLSAFLNICILVICSIIVALTAEFAIRLYGTFSVHNLYNLIPFVGVFIFVSILSLLAIKINKYSKKLFLIILSLTSIIIYFLWNHYAQTAPVNDYQVLFEGAEKMVKGTFSQESFDKTGYFYIYNYQIGYASYLALVMKIFGSRLLWFKVLEALFMTGSSILIYKITDKVLNSDAAAVSSVLYAVFIPNITGSSIINNQHLSTLFLLLSIYFLLKGTLKSTVLAGILLGFVQLFRPLAIIVIIAAFLYYLCNALKSSAYKKYILSFILLFLCYTVIVKGFDFMYVKSGLAPSPVSSNNAKYFKFILGVRGKGLYGIQTETARKTQVYFDLKTLNFDYNKYNEECLKVLKESLSNYKATAEFVRNKMYHFMGDRDNQYSFALDNSKETKSIFTLIDFGQLQYILLLVLAFASLIIRLFKHRGNIDLFSILIIGFILVHMFIETQPRYRYEVYAFLTILASGPLSVMINKFRLINKEKESLS